MLPETLSRLRKPDMAAPTREEVDAKLAANEAKVERQLADFRVEMADFRAEMREFRADVRSELAGMNANINGKLAEMQEKISGKLTTTGYWSGVFALGGLIVALFALVIPPKFENMRLRLKEDITQDLRDTQAYAPPVPLGRSNPPAAPSAVPDASQPLGQQK